MDPDVLGLQEVLGSHQAAQLAKALNMNYAYIPHGIKKHGTWWGVAILSKFPIQKIRRQVISSGYSNSRANLIAEISVFGKNIVFFCVHRDKDQTGEEALSITMKQVKKTEGLVVLMGDLNILPNDERFPLLSVRLEDTALMVDTRSAGLCKKEGTYLSQDHKKTGKRIDYILVDKGQFETLNVGCTGEQYRHASDHRGYYAKVLIKQTTKLANPLSAR